MIKIKLKGHRGAFHLDVELELPMQDITAIYGRSSSGKTTLLRAIAGLERLQGEVAVGSEVWQSLTLFMPVHKRRVGFIFQDPSLFAHLSVRDNLLYGVARNSHDAGLWQTMVDDLELATLLDRRINRLSGGERQRVALARAMLAKPQVLLMDEPLSSLDSFAKAEILPLIKNLSHKFKLKIIYVSHDDREISALSANVYPIEKGKIIF
jgi:molybdate transport system ATP-binding protein